MPVTIEFSLDSIAMIREQAAANNTTAEDFIRRASEKAARNAAYLAKLDRAFQQSIDGKCTPHELIEFPAKRSGSYA